MLDVFLDRRLTRDDGRGLGQGVLDNRETISTFKVLFELRQPRNSQPSYPTRLAHHLSIELLYPVHLFHQLPSHPWISSLNFFVKSSILPSDYHLVNLRTLNDHTQEEILIPSNRLAVILRRFASDCDSSIDSEPVIHLFLLKKKNNISLPAFFRRFLRQQCNSFDRSNISLLTTYSSNDRF